MNEPFINAPSSHDIAMRVVDLFEDTYNPWVVHKTTPEAITLVNDALIGRPNDGLISSSILSDIEDVKRLVKMDEERFPASVARIISDISLFEEKKNLRGFEVALLSNEDNRLDYYTSGEHFEDMPVVTQAEYDAALEKGIPPRFFQHVYFDHVTFYGVPEGADYSTSRFNDCKFIGCQLDNCDFSSTAGQVSFYNSDIANTNFYRAHLDHTYFFDSNLDNVSFDSAQVSMCRFTDCTMHKTDLFISHWKDLDLVRVEAAMTQNLNTAAFKITQYDDGHDERIARLKEILAPPCEGYELNYGHLGHGVTVWNSLQEKNGDYQIVAHINSDRSVIFNDDNLPEALRLEVIKFAESDNMPASATQDEPVLREPTKVQKSNYNALVQIAPDVVNGTSDYIRLQAGEGFMPLSIQKIGPDTISIMHYYFQNGDLMRDPDMELHVDSQSGAIRSLSYRQDGIGEWQNVLNSVSLPDLEVLNDNFLDHWLRNIESQGYVYEKMHVEQDGHTVELKYDAEGNIKSLDGPPEAVAGYMQKYGIDLPAEPPAAPPSQTPVTPPIEIPR